MSEHHGNRRTKAQLSAENAELRLRLEEAEQTLEESEAHFRTVFESGQDAVVILNNEGVCMQANPAAATVFGLPPEQLPGRSMADFIDLPFDFGAIWRALLARGFFHGALRVQDAHGQVRDMDAYLVARILPGRHLAVLHDVTERERAKYALQEANTQLQAQAAELETQTEELRAQTDELALANETLHRSEDRLRLAQQAGRVGVFDRDLRNDTVVWAPELEELFGMSVGGFRGRHEDWIKQVHPEDRARMASMLREWIQSGRREEAWEYRIIRADDAIRWMEGRGRILRDPNGKALRIIGTNTDITERKQAEEALRESEERLKRAQEIAHLGSWELDFANDRLSWSDEVYRIFGLEPQEFGATYEAFLEAVHPDDRAAVDAAYSGSLREGRDTYEIEHRIVRKSTGEVRVVHEKCEHFRDASGRILRSVGMVHDVTERKRAEEALRELNATLETKVAERTGQLEHRARQLQRLTLELSEAEDRERRHLAEILHDDLQQQLAAAKFHLSLLSNRAKSDRTQQMMIGQIDRMLMDAIQKSRSLSHELSPAVLYQSGLPDALSWLAEQIRTRHGLDVAVDAFGEVAVASDALKTFLYRTAQELLFNVVKHARTEKARIRIRCFGHCLCLSVSDRGRGFDPQELRETTGFGLLSIRERVELLGGRMKIHSAPGRGATFHIVLPDGQQKSLLHREETDGTILQSPMVAPTAPLQSSLAALHQQPHLRVLVADDHEIVREGLASLLQEEAGIEVVGQAANGREAVDLTDQLRPDVVIMDVAMPLINGDEATRQIKTHLPETRVVALSMHDQADLVERMYRAGAESYILKTAPAEELLAAVRGPHPAHAL